MYIIYVAYFTVNAPTLHTIRLRAGKELPMEPGGALSAANRRSKSTGQEPAAILCGYAYGQ